MKKTTGKTYSLPREAAADLLFLGGNIITMDPGKPAAQAVAIKEGRFWKVGKDEEVKALGGRKTKMIALKGRTVTPGFIDSHQHLSQVATNLLQVDCSPKSCKSIGQLLDRVRRDAQKKAPGEWIRGNGYDDTKMADRRILNRADLDGAAPAHPVFIQHVGGHWAVVNTKALEAGGIDDNTRDPKGGALGRDPAGKLNGVLFEQAEFAYIFEEMSGREPVIPTYSLKDRMKGLRMASEMYLASGITSVHDAMVSARGLEAYQASWKKGELKLRVYLLMTQEYLPSLSALRLKTGFGSEWLKLGGIKILADGAIAGRTAFLDEPYVGSGEKGILVAESEEALHQSIRQGHQAGFQVCVHANGDRAIEMTLDGFEKALQDLPRKDHRHRIEHCTVVNERILRRMKRLKLLAVPFGSYVHHHGEKMIACYGAERVERMFAHRSFLDWGIPVSGSSDNPCGPYEPLLAIQSCVTRKSADGQVLGAGQRITPEEAIFLYTRASAYASFDEGLKGSLEPGKLADLVVLGEDPRRVSPDEIRDIPVEMTLVGGEVRYKR